MLFIETERLKLIPLNHQQLLLYRDNLAVLEQLLGLNTSVMQIVPHFEQEIAEAMQNFWLPNTETYPELYPWYTNWIIVLRDINTMIGGIGYGGYPDDYGATTIGYMIDQQHWCKNYASEALAAMIRWGFSYSVLKVIIADTTLDNMSSQRVLQKAGFRKTHTNNGAIYYHLHK